MICDSHIHVGQYYEKYTSPQELSLLMKNLEVEKYAVSSTTVCERNYQKVIEEFQSLILLDGYKVYPILWLTSGFFDIEDLSELFMSSGIPWCALKIHPDWQPNVWFERNLQRNTLVLAKKLKIPILIHTGAQEYSEAKVWEPLIRDNPEQKFILAHCRPFNQAFELIKRYENAYGDLSFVDVSDFHYLHDSEVCKRMLWGSDLPIVSHYLDDDIQVYYYSRLHALERILNNEEYLLVTQVNFNCLFNKH